MLKFSGFADLTSCLVEVSCQLKASDTDPKTTQHVAPSRHFVFVASGSGTYETHMSGVQDTLTHNCTQAHRHVNVLE